ncbi:hypothetical protein MTR_3g090220 [Medicago truncatula]|uniref:Uncharacterized protein n=1 Tax=Medicago truncatula TaxID=3880 RepID=A0A072V175_MEDTR|nr:hypothetical protein MTR_3g090220 [Medicago truncatula]
MAMLMLENMHLIDTLKLCHVMFTKSIEMVTHSLSWFPGSVKLNYALTICHGFIW